MTRRYPTAAAELAAYLGNSPHVGIADASGLNVGARGEMASAGADLLEAAHDRGALRTKPTPYAVAPTEHEEQVALFEWADLMQGEHPELCMLFAIPNGGARHPAVAAQLKAEGVKAGVPDIFLACARGGNGGKVYHGMFLELKRASRTNHATPAQKEWIERLRYHGYAAVICYGATEAINAIMGYLSQE